MSGRLLVAGVLPAFILRLRLWPPLPESLEDTEAGLIETESGLAGGSGYLTSGGVGAVSYEGVRTRCEGPAEGGRADGGRPDCERKLSELNVPNCPVDTDRPCLPLDDWGPYPAVGVEVEDRCRGALRGPLSHP